MENNSFDQAFPTEEGKSKRDKKELKALCEVFGKNMRFERKVRGLKTELMANFLGISTAYVGLIERGERTPSLDVFMKICNFFSETAESMLSERKTWSVGENGSKRVPKDEPSQKELKKKNVVGMLDTFEEGELNHIVEYLKIFKKFKTESN